MTRPMRLLAITLAPALLLTQTMVGGGHTALSAKPLALKLAKAFLPNRIKVGGADLAIPHIKLPLPQLATAMKPTSTWVGGVDTLLHINTAMLTQPTWQG